MGKLNIHLTLDAATLRYVRAVNNTICRLTPSVIVFDETSPFRPHITLVSGFLKNGVALNTVAEHIACFSHDLHAYMTTLSHPYVVDDTGFIFCDATSDAIARLKTDLIRAMAPCMENIKTADRPPHITVGYIAHDQALLADRLRLCPPPPVCFCPAIEVSNSGVKGTCIDSLYVFPLRSAQLDFQRNHSVADLEDHFTSYVSRHFSSADQNSLLACLEDVKRHHGSQQRSDGSLYVTHLIRVALMIGQYMAPDRDLTLAGLLHDVLEDTDYAPADLKAAYGPVVLALVEGVTLQKTETDRQAWRDRKLQKWRETMAAPQAVRVIKTFDGLDNLIALKFITPDQPGYAKIPRWLMQAREMKLPLAQKTNATAYALMQQEIAFYHGQGFQSGTWFSD